MRRLIKLICWRSAWPVLFVLSIATLVFAQSYNHTTMIWDYSNGIRASVIGPTVSGSAGLGAAMTLGTPEVTSLALATATKTMIQDAVGVRLGATATQTIAAGDIIAADSCGSLKQITAAGAVTTSTTDSITAPAAANTDCIMMVCNVGAETITIDKNANILLVGGADVALLANSCLAVSSNGTTWRQLTAQLTAT